jgi:hypothetical protein
MNILSPQIPGFQNTKIWILFYEFQLCLLSFLPPPLCHGVVKCNFLYVDFAFGQGTLQYLFLLNTFISFNV